MNKEEFTPEEIQDATFPLTEDRVIPIIEAAALSRSDGKRFSTGNQAFDDAMGGGFETGDLAIVSGRPGNGKTTYAQTLTYHLTKAGVPCLWFSYEVTLEKLNRKFLDMGIAEHYHAYAPAKNTTGKLEWVKAKIREGLLKYNTTIIFIDDIDNLVPVDTKTGDSREVNLKNIAIQLKSLAIELGVIIVLMAHVKKTDHGQELTMEDIGYSAGITQKADFVFIVSRKMEEQKRGFRKSGEAIATNYSFVKIVKNRPTGILKSEKLIYANGRLNPIDAIHGEPLARAEDII